MEKFEEEVVPGFWDYEYELMNSESLERLYNEALDGINVHETAAHAIIKELERRRIDGEIE